MSLSFNEKGSINWPELDRRLISERYTLASRARKPLEKFEHTWVILNHYYERWPYPPPVPRVERQRIRAFAQSAVITPRWEHFRTLNTMKAKMPLPLLRTTRGGNVTSVPGGLAPRTYVASELSPEDFLETCYQVRCDSVHGNRPATGYQNELRFLFVGPGLFDLVALLHRDTTLK